MTELAVSDRNVPIDWLLAVRKYGLDKANKIEDFRLLCERDTGCEVTFDEALAALDLEKL
jgi:hypothetical protein